MTYRVYYTLRTDAHMKEGRTKNMPSVISCHLDIVEAQSLVQK